MRIDRLRCETETEMHIWSRHRVTVREVEDAVYQHGLAIRGRSKGVYSVLGRTEEGRYLTIVVRYLGDCTVRLITARDMSRAERRRYDRHTAH